MGKIFGSEDGLVTRNQLGQKVEPLVTPTKLKTVYLTGLDISTEDDKPLPDSTYQTYIDNAVGMLELYLDISITPVRDYLENRDYRLNDYADWGYFMLNNYPVICVTSIKLTYFRDAVGIPEVIQEIPTNWIRLQPHDGIVRLIPNARFPASLQISATGNYFPEILRAGFVPHLWEITYDYGFEDGKIPVFMNAIIAQLSALQALVVGGNLVLGAGIAAQSISIDGLAESIQTTQSPENSAFSATIREYTKRIFGASRDDPFSSLKILRNYYRGQELNII